MAERYPSSARRHLLPVITGRRTYAVPLVPFSDIARGLVPSPRANGERVRMRGFFAMQLNEKE